MDYSTLATSSTVETTAAALAAKGFKVSTVATSAEALQKVISLIPEGKSVMNGASMTLEQIGFVDYLKTGEHGWNNLHEGIVNEKDPAKQATLRQEAVNSDYYLGSAHAVTENGNILVASNTGSQLPHLVFTSKHLIFVVGTQKIVPTVADAFDRLDTYVVPKEDVHMQEKYGVGTAVNKVVLLKGENPMMGRTIHVIFVKEKLGF
jgi:L-lactate utilization protein LutB